MRRNIKIVLLILSYAINFAHDLQMHEHIDRSTANSSHNGIEHFHALGSYCNLSKNEPHEQPFRHCHLEHSHEDVLLRNSIKSSLNSVTAEIFDYSYFFQPPINLLTDYIQNNERNHYQSFNDFSLYLRAPPEFS